MIEQTPFRPSRRRSLAWLAALAASVPFWTASAAMPRRIAVTARRFVFTPDRIALHKNESVILELTALDVVMGFSVPDLGIRTDLPPGKKMEVPIHAAAAGSHLFLCDIFCGSGHESMNGLIEVS
ncbi:hypothetical protein LMG23992_04520 [Cupriavidus laharis]|uniref:Nitrous-oxide reductase n=1 Tax=Cupriavidus laharis TaxID=151654 RepID=A0ABN7Z8C2_9BURK|nr:cupredoxin domain-containing protein [Cupriavidus laharis]CAG9181493.1 hypothetical protein LMG23992_04520 [Cupriavidus laharis]